MTIRTWLRQPWTRWLTIGLGMLAAAAISPPVVRLFDRDHNFADAIELTVLLSVLFALMTMRLLRFARECSRQRRELADVVERLRIAEAGRLQLLRRTVEAGELERARIAMELHDGPIQRISAACLRLELLSMKADDGELLHANDVLDGAKQWLSESVHSLRMLMADLRPPVLDEQGIGPAVTSLVQQFVEETGIECSFDDETDGYVSRDVQGVIYRVMREALQNVRRHSQATKVRIGMRSAGDIVTFAVADNGVGFDPYRPKAGGEPHIGIMSMRERVEMAEGTFAIESSSKGTTVAVTLPRVQLRSRRDAVAYAEAVPA